MAEFVLPRLREAASQLVEDLLEETGVAALSGVPFGRRDEELWAGLSFVDFDGAAAIAASAETPGELGLEPISRWCPRTVEAVESDLRLGGGSGRLASDHRSFSISRRSSSPWTSLATIVPSRSISTLAGRARMA